MRDSHVREIVFRLKQDIIARSAESRALAAASRELRGEVRHRKQMERRAFGRCTRWHLLAYAWLRRRPYVVTERRAVVPVEPHKIVHVLRELGVDVDAGLVRRWAQGESPGFAGSPERAADAPASPPGSTGEGQSCAAGSTS